MNMNLKTFVLALVAGLVLTACADESACAPKANDPAPAVETTPEPSAVTTTSETAQKEKQTKCRRARRAKKDKVSMPTDGKQKPARRRRTRKMDSAEIPVTGMLDSAE